MDIRFSSRAFKYLQSRQAAGITFYLVDLETGGSIGAVRDVGVRLEPPARPQNFRYDRAEGFDIYIERNLKVTEPVVIKKQGFWKFSWLYAEGLRIHL